LRVSRLEFIHHTVRTGQQLGHAAIAHLIAGIAALVDFAHPVTQCVDQGCAALAIVEQIVFQIGIAAHCPDVAQHLVEHARRATGAALTAQFAKGGPGLLAEQPDDDFTVRKRGVVVRDLAQATFLAGLFKIEIGGNQLVRGVHQAFQKESASGRCSAPLGPHREGRPILADSVMRRTAPEHRFQSSTDLR
jgi:hypothetical protein